MDLVSVIKLYVVLLLFGSETCTMVELFFALVDIIAAVSLLGLAFYGLRHQQGGEIPPGEAG